MFDNNHTAKEEPFKVRERLSCHLYDDEIVRESFNISTVQLLKQENILRE